jgi:hypothetical protein
MPSEISHRLYQTVEPYRFGSILILLGEEAVERPLVSQCNYCGYLRRVVGQMGLVGSQTAGVQGQGLWS